MFYMTVGRVAVEIKQSTQKNSKHSILTTDFLMLAVICAPPEGSLNHVTP